MKTRIQGNLFAVVSLVFGSFGAAGIAHADPFPSGSWTNLKGESVRELPTSRDVLVVLWATWCPDCRVKMKTDLPEMAKRKDFEILMVNIENDRRRVQSFVDRENLPFQVYQDLSETYRKSIRSTTVPHWALYRRDTAGGYTLVKTQPAFDRAEIEKLLKL